MAHPKSGFYIKDGYEYVSQSTVIGETDPWCNPDKLKGLDIWRNTEPDWQDVHADACKRGTILHKEIELALGAELVSSEQLTNEEQEYEFDMKEWQRLHIPEYVTQLIPFLDSFRQLKDKSNKKKDYCAEEESYSPFGFACTKDLRGWIGYKKVGREYRLDPEGDGELVHAVLDWKNVRPPKEGKEPKAKPRSYHTDNFLQLGANAIAHNQEVLSGKDAPMITHGVIVAMYNWREPKLHILEPEELKQYAFAFLERWKIYQQLHKDKFPRLISS